MKNRIVIKLNKYITVFAIPVMMMFMSGCGAAKEDALVPPKDVSYAAVNPTVVLVERGDLSPKKELKLELLGYENIKYRFSLAEYTELVETYKLEVEDVNVNVGDVVHEGDVLVSFHSEVLDDKIRENQKKKRDAGLEIEHLKVLSDINESNDYSYDIAKKRRELEAADLHVSDVRNTYNKLSLVAEKDGVVSFVNSIIQNGYIKPDNDIISVVSGKGLYTAPKNTGNTFKVGEKYTCMTSASEYQLEVVDTPEGESDDLVYFRPVDENLHLTEQFLILQIDLPVQKDVCYVNKRAIVEKGDKFFIYVVKENGMQRVVEVKTGEKVDDYIIITEGLEGGETVVVQQ